jgi:hypothetical protein
MFFIDVIKFNVPISTISRFRIFSMSQNPERVKRGAEAKRGTEAKRGAEAKKGAEASRWKSLQSPIYNSTMERRHCETRNEK